MKFKFFLTAVLVSAMTAAGSAGVYADTAAQSVSVYIDGQPIEYTAENYPQILGDRTMVPIRATAEKLGMTVDWDNATRTMTFTRGDDVITHEMTTNKMTVNGTEKTYDASSVVINNLTYMPLIMLADVTGLEPIWDPASKSVFLAPMDDEPLPDEDETDADESDEIDESDETDADDETAAKPKYDDKDIKMEKYIPVNYDTGKDKDGGKAVNYVYQTDNGGFVVANLNNELYINVLNSDLDVIAQKRIYKDGFEIGGYFYYNNCHYVLFGKDNLNEQNSTVYRLTKYNPNFETSKSVNVMGDNSQIAQPFRKGKVNMVFDGNTLTICDVGLRYKENNKNSDCNVAISINLKDFVLSDVDITSESNTNSASVRNSGLGHKAAYISDNSIAIAGLSDARPKGLYLKAEEIGTDDEEAESFITVMESRNRGSGDIGIELGGFEISDKYCIITGTAAAQDEDYDDDLQRNIFVSRVSKSEINEKYMQTTMITDYDEDSGIKILYQKLIKYSENTFLLMWQELDEDGDSLVKYVYINGDGETIKTTPLSDDDGIVTIKGRLSSSQPLLSTDKKTVYFAMTEDDGEPIELYSMALSAPTAKK